MNNMKKFLVFIFILPLYFNSHNAFGISPTTNFSETCKKTNELTATALTCYNEQRPLESIGFYFGCSQMLQYSIITKKDGRIKYSPKKLIFNINKIYYRPKFNENKYYINRKTLELKNSTHVSIGQCKIESGPKDINESLESILKNNTTKNKI
tara:strand:+ start:109 stop:567 length:459 start_codon:yes stop_codon:yes gene_type:complete